MSELTKSAADPILQWVTYQLAGETYGLNVMQVQEVLRLTDIAPVPGSPDYVLGIINLRGNVVTVLDTRRRFNLPPHTPTDAARIIVVEVSGRVIGMLVDSVTEVVYLHQSEIDSAPTLSSEESSRFIQGVYSRDNKLLILVDIHKLLGDEELAETVTA